MMHAQMPPDPWGQFLAHINDCLANRKAVDQAARDLDSHAIAVTFFRDEAAGISRHVPLALPQLADLITKQTAADKMQLPWLKLATFGSKRSEKNCLRTNENVLTISGIEGDYDGEEISFDTAVATARKAGIRCIICTSPSYAPSTKERWRILVPLSQPREPEVREKFVARLNGLFEGKLAGESFTLSLSYLFGHVDGAEYRVEAIDGDYLDRRDDLHAGSIYKGGAKVGTGGHDFNSVGPQPRSRRDDPDPADSDKIEAALNVVDSNCSYEVWLKIAAALRHELGEHGFELFDRWSAKAKAVYTQAAAKERWRGARTMKDVTISTLFHYADQADTSWRQRYADAERARIVAQMAADVGAAGNSSGARDTSDEFAAKPGPGSSTQAPPPDPDDVTDPGHGVTIDDFYAYMPNHNYIFVPTREMWPSESVNSRLPPVALLKKDGAPVLDAKGKPRHSTPSSWLDKHRPVEQMTWAPGEPMVVANRLIAEGGWLSRAGTMTFNLYRPPTIRQGNSANADRWCDLVRRVYPADADHIITYCAHRVQYPAIKINHALLLGGAPGIGKDTLLEPLKHGVGPWNFREVSPQEIMGNYNDYMRCVVLRISEIRDLGEVNRFTFYEHMKTITASPPDVLRVNGKYVPHHHVLNVAGVIYTTNHRFDGIYLPADDRRHYMAWSELSSASFVSGFWPGIWSWYGSGGLEDVVAYLAERDLSKFDPKAPPEKTAAFWAIVGAGAAPEESELADVLDILGLQEKAEDANGKPCGPVVTTLARVLAAAQGGLFDWLSDRKNRRVIPHRFERCGYTPVRNEAAKDGLWVIGGKRQVVYGRLDVASSDRVKAAADLK